MGDGENGELRGVMKEDTVFQISNVDFCVWGRWQKHMKVCIMKKATGIKLGCLDHDLALVNILSLDNVYIHMSFSPV